MKGMTKRILDILPTGTPNDIETLYNIVMVRNHPGSTVWCANQLGIDTRIEEDFKQLRSTLAHLSYAGMIDRVKVPGINRFIYNKQNNELPTEIEVVRPDVAARMVAKSKKFFTKSANIDVFLDPDEMQTGLFDIESTGLTGDFSCILCAVIKPFKSHEPMIFKIDLDKRDMLEAEKEMLLEFVPVLESFSGLIGYYSTRFDMPMIRTRCMFHGIPAPKKIKHLDMYFTIRRTVNPTTRRMDRINEINRLTDESLPEKTKLGIREWTGAAFRRDEESLNYIVDHCVHDVEVLERILNKYRDYVPEKIIRY